MGEQNIIVVLTLCFVICISVTAADDTLNHELLARIEALEQQGLQQASHLKRLESLVDLQNKQHADDVATSVHYQQRVAKLEEEVQHLRKINYNLTTAGNDDLDSRLPRLAALGAIGFHAIIRKPGTVDHIGINQKIVFPDVLLNYGRGYHSQNGVFFAPTRGLYLFSTSILSSSNTHDIIAVHLIKNGVVLGNAYAHSDTGRHDQGAISVLTELVPGDEVWVSLYNPPDTSLWGDSCTSFMGTLVRET